MSDELFDFENVGANWAPSGNFVPIKTEGFVDLSTLDLDEVQPPATTIAEAPKPAEPVQPTRSIDLSGIAAPTDYNVVTSHFGMRTLGGETRPHYGVDIRAPEGTPIKAFTGGKVVKIVRDFVPKKGPGKYVVIESPDGAERTSYFHLSKIADDLKVGDVLGSGQQFASSGNTGRSQSAHLHMEISRKNKQGEYEQKNPLELYPNHFQKYTDKSTGEPVNIEKMLTRHMHI